MTYGLIGNFIWFGGGAFLFGYCVWEINQMSKNMAKIDDTHPMNEVYKPENFHKFLKYKKIMDADELLKNKKGFSRKTNENLDENDDADI